MLFRDWLEVGSFHYSLLITGYNMFATLSGETLLLHNSGAFLHKKQVVSGTRFREITKAPYSDLSCVQSRDSSGLPDDDSVDLLDK